MPSSRIRAIVLQEARYIVFYEDSVKYHTKKTESVDYD